VHRPWCETKNEAACIYIECALLSGGEEKGERREGQGDKGGGRRWEEKGERKGGKKDEGENVYSMLYSL